MHKAGQILIEDLFEIDLGNALDEFFVWLSLENVETCVVFTACSILLVLHVIFFASWVES